MSHRGYKQGQNIKDGSMDNTWNIRRLVDESIVLATQHIVLKIVEFHVAEASGNCAYAAEGRKEI